MGCQGDPTELRTGCWAGHKGALLHPHLQDLTPLSLHSGCCHEGEGKGREALCRGL